MLDNELNDLVQKYGIDEMKVKAWGTSCENRYKKRFKQAIGMLRLAWILNSQLDEIEDENIALCGEYGKFVKGIFFLLLPRNRHKIRYFVPHSDSYDLKSFYGRNILKPWEIKQNQVRTIILLARNLEWYAYFIGEDFQGKIIDVYTLIHEKQLESYFEGVLKQNPYADIFIACRKYAQAETLETRKLWHKRLISSYLSARDFLNCEKEIQKYVEQEYEDVEKLVKFGKELKKFLCNLKEKMMKRTQRDVFLYWIDQEEKEDFYSMHWIGNISEGIDFSNAYTVMTYTTPVMCSIFTGNNVKAGYRKELQIGKRNTKIKQEDIFVFGRAAIGRFEDGWVHPYANNVTPYAPAMLGFWYALDAVLSSTKPCVCLMHCMETHSPYISGRCHHWQYEGWHQYFFPIGQGMDYAEVARESRDYLDRQLEWYYDFLSSNASAVYFSDHGGEQDLSEKNVNMPFKIVRRNVKPYTENRVFSYKNMYRLIYGLMHSDMMTNDFFEKYAVIDQIDPYSKAFAIKICEEGRCHFSFVHRKLAKQELKKYIATTKVVTDQGEYYTINILGEETYYRDKECKLNLVGDSAWGYRIAELREKAGKFYNPWKEKRQVAIDFYEYLGIKEEDILAQCY